MQITFKIIQIKNIQFTFCFFFLAFYMLHFNVALPFLLLLFVSFHLQFMFYNAVTSYNVGFRSFSLEQCK